MKKIIFLLVVFIISCKSNQTHKVGDGLFELFEEKDAFYSDKEGVLGQNGMAVSAHPIASQIGIDILKQGGNAIDASVAMHFALAVVHPFAGNLGGGGFAMIRMANGEVSSLDFREKAPAAASVDMYLDAEGNVIEGLSTKGHLASGVPGSVDGMVEMHKKYGKLSWQKCLQPAIDLAIKGVKLSPNNANGFNKYKSIFDEVNGTESPYFKKENKETWVVGDLHIQKDLGMCLQRISEQGKDGFYRGETAKLLVDEMKNGGGIITLEDLENYNSVWRKPLSGNYRGYKIHSMAPPSSGGIALIQLLEMVEPYPLEEWGFNKEKTVQVMIEAERRAYADRAKYLGDTDFVNVPTETLLSKAYLDKIWNNVDFSKATLSSDISGGNIAGFESDETTHYSVVDKEGNAVAITTTINGAYGSKVVVQGGGFLMNNEMDDFSVKAGVPNMFGLVGNKANEIQPGKRMLSSMTPTIVEKDNKLFLTVGTPGGSTIITSVYQTILNVIDHKMNIQEAVNAKKFHHQWLPDKIVFEKNAMSPTTINALLKKEYTLEEQTGTLGRMDCIQVLPNGMLMGGSDPRSENKSVGY